MKSYKGVKSGRGCEGVTVGRCARGGARAARMVVNLVGSSGFQLLPGGLLCITGPHHIGKASIPSVQQPQRTSALSAGRLAPRCGLVGRGISLAPPTHLSLAASASHALPEPH